MNESYDKAIIIAATTYWKNKIIIRKFWGFWKGKIKHWVYLQMFNSYLSDLILDPRTRDEVDLLVLVV